MTKKEIDAEKFQSRPKAKLIIIFLSVWAVVATVGWFNEYNRAKLQMRAEGEKFAKELTAAREYEFIVRFIDVYYNFDSAGQGSPTKDVQDYLSTDLSQNLSSRIKETLELFASKDGKQTAQVFKIVRNREDRKIVVYLQVDQEFKNGERERLLLEVKASVDVDAKSGKDSQKLVITKWTETVLEAWPAIFNSKLISMNANSSVVLRFPCKISSMNLTENIKQQVNPRESEVQLFTSENIPNPSHILAACDQKKFDLEVFSDPQFDTIFWKVDLKDAVPVPKKLSKDDKLREVLKKEFNFEIQK